MVIPIKQHIKIQTLPPLRNKLHLIMSLLFDKFQKCFFMNKLIRDLDDNILETLYITEQDVSPQSIPMTNFSYDISQYGGSTVRIDVYMRVRNFYLDAAFDNFFIEDPQRPPGWDKGKKSGWDGSRPPGLEKKDKIPAGFEQGNKGGWAKD